MALPSSSPLSFALLSPSPSCPHPSIAIAPNPSSRLQHKNLILQQWPSSGLRVTMPRAFGERRSVVVRSSSEIDGKDAVEPEGKPSEGSEEAVSVENLPLESKQQMMMEQKLRMKLAKKIRLRRKRLLRKRRMRKKGRWPPSKMKKLKNV